MQGRSKSWPACKEKSWQASVRGVRLTGESSGKVHRMFPSSQCRIAVAAESQVSRNCVRVRALRDSSVRRSPTVNFIATPD